MHQASRTARLHPDACGVAVVVRARKAKRNSENEGTQTSERESHLLLDGRGVAVVRAARQEAGSRSCFLLFGGPCA